MQTTEQKQSLFDRHPVSMTLVILAFVLGTVTAIGFVLTTDASSADAVSKIKRSRSSDLKIALYERRDQSNHVQKNPFKQAGDNVNTGQEPDEVWDGTADTDRFAAEAEQLDTGTGVHSPDFRLRHWQRLCPHLGVKPYTDTCELELLDWWVEHTKKADDR